MLALGGVFGLILCSGMPFCPMAGLFGIPCPGCGLTRATLALAHGHLREAFAFHPLAFVLSPLFIMATSSAALTYVRGPRATAVQRVPNAWFASRGATALASALLVVTLGVWGLRFLGYFGGPVRVVTLSAWGRALGGSRD